MIELNPIENVMDKLVKGEIGHITIARMSSADAGFGVVIDGIRHGFGSTVDKALMSALQDNV